MTQTILQLDIIPNVLSGFLRWSTLCQKTRVDFAEAFLEVSQPDKDDTNVDESEVGDDRKDIDDQLLSKLQVLDVDCIEAGLSAAADSKEESIDGRNVAETSEDCECDQGAANNVNV